MNKKEIADFKDSWGQSHEEICANLGYDEEGSDDLLADEYFWIDEDKIWCNKSSSLFTKREQEIADYLKGL